MGGSIPITIGDISSLQVLDLSHNNLTGSIPMSLSNLRYLEQLDLSFNNTSGEVPLKGIFSNVTAVLHVFKIVKIDLNMHFVSI